MSTKHIVVCERCKIEEPNTGYPLDGDALPDGWNCVFVANTEADLCPNCSLALVDWLIAGKGS